MRLVTDLPATMALKALRTALTDLLASSLNDPLVVKDIDIDADIDIGIVSDSSNFILGMDESIRIGDEI